MTSFRHDCCFLFMLSNNGVEQWGQISLIWKEMRFIKFSSYNFDSSCDTVQNVKKIKAIILFLVFQSPYSINILHITFPPVTNGAFIKLKIRIYKN